MKLMPSSALPKFESYGAGLNSGLYWPKLKAPNDKFQRIGRLGLALALALALFL
jgi:hypothetical protein